MTKSGTVDEFSAFFTVKPGQAENLRKAADEYVNSPARKGGGGQAGIVKTGIRELRLTLFDNDTRLLFATSFDTAWDPYVDNSLLLMGGSAPWGHFLQYTVEAPPGIEIRDKIPNAATKEFLNQHRVQAAAYDNSYPTLTGQRILKGMRLVAAFEKVLENPDAATALSHPALKPLLDEASD